MRSIVIVDYGMGNIFSIQKAFSAIGETAVISSCATTIKKADFIILPGVGAFERAMKELKTRNLIEAIYSFVQKQRPLLGICLGMQLLFTDSTEFGHHFGLDLIKGSVTKFRKPEEAGNRFKIPQIGWNSLYPPSQNKSLWQGTILKSIEAGSSFYFVHSYVCKPENKENILSETIYGIDTFCSATYSNAILGCQFHPEKSGPKGLQIYQDFLSI